jgi:regulator of protease activity HflC (stomatin/prohibitin superfamily)
MSPKALSFLIAIVLAVVVALGTAGSMVETVEKGTYQIKQAAGTGTITAHMEPGWFGQFFGTVQTWPKAQTFYFTKDSEEGGSGDQSFEVRFNQGSLCDISGTLRIIMPTSQAQAIALATTAGYKSYGDLESKLIMPTVRNALRLTANLMSARESYSDKRNDFNSWARDQIQNGLYETVDVVREVKDLVSGETVEKRFKEIKRDATGAPIYQANPLEGTGIVLSNFEIKAYEYETRVKEQITSQQTAFMAVQTSRARAQEAEQDRLTAEAQGKADVMTAQYEKEEEKVRATVEAQKDSAVIVIAAQRDFVQAQTLALAAAETKKQQVLLGEGEAERKRLVMAADGALEKKLDAYVKTQQVWAEAFAKRSVPATMIGGQGEGGGGSDGDVALFMKLIGVQAARQLAVDVNPTPTQHQRNNNK